MSRLAWVFMALWMVLTIGITLPRVQAAAPQTNTTAEADYTAIRQANNGRLAQPQKNIYTTEQAVIFTFGGLSKSGALSDLLDKMDKENIKGTFFVTERELKRNKANVDMIAARGHELAIGLRINMTENKMDSFQDICGQIARIQKALKAFYGVENNLVMEMMGAQDEVMLEAVSAMGCQLFSRSVNVVRTKDKQAHSAEEIMATLFGKGVRSLARGQIVYIRTDFYDKETLAGDVMLAVKKEKVDNIAYTSFEDTPEINPANDSAYRITGIGQVLQHKESLYQYPVSMEKIPQRLQPGYVAEPVDKSNFSSEFRRRYIGSPTVDGSNRMLGFSKREMRLSDRSGIIQQVPYGTVFLTFDDWGNDDSVNKLLYVLRKHHVPATFFIITWNMPNNPNLLRAIAKDGHDIGSHTNAHKSMAVYDESKDKAMPVMNRDEYAIDVAVAYEKLAKTIGDVEYNGRYPLTRLFRPPTLAINKEGIQSIFDAGYSYIVAGFESTEDYAAPLVTSLVGAIQNGIYDEKHRVRSGSVIVMHMTQYAVHTARALDMLLTENEKRREDDPLKFRPALLSQYLVPGYDQNSSGKEQAIVLHPEATAIQDSKH